MAKSLTGPWVAGQYGRQGILSPKNCQAARDPVAKAAAVRSRAASAARDLAAGKTTPVLNQLKAFNHHVRALIHSGALTEEQGAALIAKVNGTRELVGA